MAKHWSETLQCQCGAKFRNMAQEAKHRHNFPIFCRKTKPNGKLVPSTVASIVRKGLNVRGRTQLMRGVTFIGHTLFADELRKRTDAALIKWKAKDIIESVADRPDGGLTITFKKELTRDGYYRTLHVYSDHVKVSM